MKQVLIVDDDQTYLSLLARAIKLEKLEDVVLLASGAQEFRHQVAKHSTTLGLVILDINLSDQESGFDLLAWLQATHPKTPARTFLQSWTSEAQDREMASRLGSELRPKVTSFAQLRQALRDWRDQANSD